MSEPKKPLEQVIDLFIYAPLGLLMNADEVIPNLIERGRQQVTMARMFGQMAVQQGQVEAGKAATKLQDQASEVVGQITGTRSTSRPETPRPVATSAPSTGNAQPARAPRPAPTLARPSPAPEVAALAIPDYDSLSASQVVPRLEGLAPGELDAVRTYEGANRGRKTILSKITALQG
ncbi:MAG: hypothetical protein ACR2LQ_10335 [Acidimicrobiales bacterium]